MRFMIIRKADFSTEAGVLPAMRYDEALAQAGVLRAGESLQPSAKGARIKFSQGKPSVTHGPFAEAGGLVAGFMMIDVKSQEEAIEWAKRWPLSDQVGEAEIEIREAGCPGGLAGVDASDASMQAVPDPALESAAMLRFMVMLKADRNAEAGVVPDQKHLAAMARRNEESVRAGVMLAGDGLQPSSRGARVKFSGGKHSVIDGPFIEAKELIAGYWVIQAKSKEEAIEWALHYPYPFGAEAEIEIRQLF